MSSRLEPGKLHDSQTILIRAGVSIYGLRPWGGTGYPLELLLVPRVPQVGGLLGNVHREFLSFAFLHQTVHGGQSARWQSFGDFMAVLFGLLSLEQ